ncbi:MAG: branched-chain amino acid ABC transporter permease [Candidatus Protistobacter heckmanni]|nr:branched-chain amino acid ABC transporter permease [Candidatus Protistobacter heckmanni]
MTVFLDILLSGIFHASELFLVAAGLQLVFGVQKIVNLACGSFYALGAYAGVSAMSYAARKGLPKIARLPVLLASGLLLGVIGLPIERILRFVYKREEGFQLLLTFALMLLSQDIFRFILGSTPKTLGNLSLAYGQTTVGPTSMPTYKFLVILSSILIALGLGWLLQRSRFGRIVRATAEKRGMSEALGVDGAKVTVAIFTLGAVLGTVGGALIVGLIRSLAVFLYVELEILAIYLIVILVLIFKPTGLFGKPVE